MKFYKIDISDKRIFDEYFKAFQPEIADLTFTNLFMWDPFYDINFTEEDGFLLIMAKPYNQPPFLHGPVGVDTNKLPIVIEKAKKYFETQGYKFMLKRASQKTIDMLTQCGMKFESLLERDLSDYVYKVQDLVQLKGKKYHAKKNHINKFLRLYGQRYEVKKLMMRLSGFAGILNVSGMKRETDKMMLVLHLRSWQLKGQSKTLINSHMRE